MLPSPPFGLNRGSARAFDLSGPGGPLAIVRTPGYLDSGIALGRAGLFFAGVSIVLIAFGFGSRNPGYMD